MSIFCLKKPFLGASNPRDSSDNKESMKLWQQKVGFVQITHITQIGYTVLHKKETTECEALG